MIEKFDLLWKILRIAIPEGRAKILRWIRVFIGSVAFSLGVDRMSALWQPLGERSHVGNFLSVANCRQNKSRQFGFSFFILNLNLQTLMKLQLKFRIRAQKNVCLMRNSLNCYYNLRDEETEQEEKWSSQDSSDEEEEKTVPMTAKATKQMSLSFGTKGTIRGFFSLIWWIDLAIGWRW